MECTINNSIKKLLFKGKSVEVIIRYIRMKHGISIDTNSILDRVKGMKQGYSFAH